MAEMKELTNIIWTDRSRSQAALRCRRQRWLEYHAGSAGRGIVPKRKNIHLCLGLAFHAGAEVLLTRVTNGVDFSDSALALDAENSAVQAALEELAKWTAAGVEVDLQEQPEKRAGDQAGGRDETNAGVRSDSDSRNAVANGGSRRGSVADRQTREQADSPIVIDFGGMAETISTESFAAAAREKALSPDLVVPDFSAPIYPGSSPALPQASSLPQSEDDRLLAEIEIHTAANEARDSGMDDYLRLELAALVEGMVRAYARRRLKPLLDEFEVLEVEREGSWKLGEIPANNRCVDCGHETFEHEPTADGDGVLCLYCDCRTYEDTQARELHWMSRHDGLLLERSSNSLYLLSYKTTGAWDRRKKADAEIDMQGLSEAVDVEKRLGEAWEILQTLGPITPQPCVGDGGTFPQSTKAQIDLLDRLIKLVSPRIAKWLKDQPAPPKILGVRYEYILKGARREDKNQPPESSRRWAQDSPLVRAYLSRGITSEDDRWAPKYEWQDIAGKEKRIDYRSWKKQAVWESMPILAWIDRLDRRDFWPGEDGYDAAGNPMDVLADQFVPPVVVYRNEDDLRDWLEQIEAQEVGVALAVEEVRRAEKEGEGAKRSALNRLFAQNRNACLWPGPCSYREICFGGEDIRRDPLSNSTLYEIRRANHPIESSV